MVGVSTDTVRRATAAQAARNELANAGLAVAGDEPGSSSTGSQTRTNLVPLARPEPRDVERALAHTGSLFGAEPVICQGASLPFVGALLILPPLGVTGLLEVAQAVYGSRRRRSMGSVHCF